MSLTVYAAVNFCWKDITWSEFWLDGILLAVTQVFYNEIEKFQNRQTDGLSPEAIMYFFPKPLFPKIGKWCREETFLKYSPSVSQPVSIIPIPKLTIPLKLVWNITNPGSAQS